MRAGRCRFVCAGLQVLLSERSNRVCGVQLGYVASCATGWEGLARSAFGVVSISATSSVGDCSVLLPQAHTLRSNTAGPSCVTLLSVLHNVPALYEVLSSPSGLVIQHAKRVQAGSLWCV
jgi:hypothetical protein